jgi:hypothetical protein
MPVKIIDRLETIQINEQKGSAPMVALRRRQQMIAKFENECPVRQPGQCIVQRGIRQVVGQRFHFGTSMPSAQESLLPLPLKKAASM